MAFVAPKSFPFPLFVISLITASIVASASASSSSASANTPLDTTMLSSTSFESAMTELTKKYESQLAALEKRLAVMEKMLEGKKSEDNNNNNGEDNWDNNEGENRLSNVVELPQEEPQESLKEEETIWLDDFLREEGISPPFDHNELHRAHEQRDRDEKQKRQKIPGKMDQKRNYGKNNLRWLRERQSKRRVKRQAISTLPTVHRDLRTPRVCAQRGMAVGKLVATMPRLPEPTDTTLGTVTTLPKALEAPIRGIASRMKDRPNASESVQVR